MKFGYAGVNAGPGADPEFAVALARLLEENGFESMWTVEHVVVPQGYGSTYPYSRSGRMPGEEVPITDPLVWLAYVAAATERINLATGIVILPQRNPVILAKEAATLDVLSRGRLILGVGVGWLREEFDALGVPFDERGARTDEYVAAMRALWSQKEPTYHGRFVSFERATCEPKPTRGSVPVVVGGHTEAAAKRAGRLGDGFFPYKAGRDDLPNLIATMRESAHAHGRDPDAIEISFGGTRDIADIGRFEELGVSRIVVAGLGWDIETLKRALGEFSERVVQRA